MNSLRALRELIGGLDCLAQAHEELVCYSGAVVLSEIAYAKARKAHQVRRGDSGKATLAFGKVAQAHRSQQDERHIDSVDAVDVRVVVIAEQQQRAHERGQHDEVEAVVRADALVDAE